MRALADATRALSVALLLCACAGSGVKAPASSELHDEQAFVVRERVRIGSGARDDFTRAVRLLEQAQYAGAIELLGHVVEEAPEATAAHIDLGIAYARVGDLEHAEASLRQALERSPQHPVALNELGIVYRRTGRFAEARRSYEKALESHPDFHFAQLNLAILCDLYLADPQCALDHYARYAQAVPGDEKTAMWIADLRARTGR